MPALPLTIEAPPVAPARFNLLDTFPPKPMPAHGGLAGIQYDSEFCGTARPWVAPCIDPPPEGKEADDGIEQAVGVPITIYHLFTCRLIGADNPRDRARRSLDLGASRAVEEGLDQAVAGVAVDITPGTTSLANTFIDIARGVAVLEEYAGENYGGVPVLHLTRAQATLAIGANVVLRVGDRLETGLGTPVVAGAGYDGSTMFMTGAVHIWEQDAVLTDVALDVPYTNQFSVLAERLYVPTYECFAASVDVAVEPT